MLPSVVALFELCCGRIYVILCLFLRDYLVHYLFLNRFCDAPHIQALEVFRIPSRRLRDVGKRIDHGIVSLDILAVERPVRIFRFSRK